jgi:hypothetical protein
VGKKLYKDIPFLISREIPIISSGLYLHTTVKLETQKVPWNFEEVGTLDN